MDLLATDFNKSTANLETLKKQTQNVFLELKASAESTGTLMSEAFLSIAQNANFAFQETSLGVAESFGAAFFAMGESASGLWLSISDSFAELWLGLNERGIVKRLVSFLSDGGVGEVVWVVFAFVFYP